MWTFIFPRTLPAHYLCDPGNSFRTTPHGAVLRGDFKLIEFFWDYFEIYPDANKNNKRYYLNVGKYVPHRKVELFNLKDDIGERHKLANKMPEKADKLLRLLDDWRNSISAQMPSPNPYYDPKAKFVPKPRR